MEPPEDVGVSPWPTGVPLACGAVEEWSVSPEVDEWNRLSSHGVSLTLLPHPPNRLDSFRRRVDQVVDAKGFGWEDVKVSGC